MATISARLVKELRDRTGLGMMDCKKALEEVDGDIDKAIELLRKNSALKAAAKANRTAAEGLLGIRIGADARRGTMVEINVETDFAARNAKFGAFLDTVTNAAFDTACDSVEALMTGDLEAERVVLVQEIGENITVGRVVTVRNRWWRDLRVCAYGQAQGRPGRGGRRGRPLLAGIWRCT